MDTSPATYDDCAKIIKANDIHTVICTFADTWGISRGKFIPSEQFLRGGGFDMASVALSWNPLNRAIPNPWAELDSEFPDMHVSPDLSSFRIAGWTEGTAIVFCDLYSEHGDDLVMDNRLMLKRSLAELSDLGYGIDMAPELEFHLFTPDWQPITDRPHCYEVDRGDELDYVIGDIRESMRRSGVLCEASNIEYGGSQVEINIRYSQGIVPIDETMIFKQIVHSVARKHGMRASFMVKPFTDASGSGMHVHQSLVDSSGKNAFAIEDRKPEENNPLTSELMSQYVAGLVEHQLEMQLLTMPTVTAYKRAEDYSFAPTQVCWGMDNRLVGIRCLTGIGPGTRLEVRWATADCNPYLVVHGYVQAGLDGIRNNLSPRPCSAGDPHADTSLPRVPRDIHTALDNFNKSEWARKAYGDMFVDTFVVMQQNEIAEFEAQVSDWEMKRYTPVF